MSKKIWYSLTAVLVIASFVLAACGGGAAATATTAPAGNKVPVGIVLPTKDEPRWIQDQTRFTDALKAAGYDVQILFSQGDSAKEKANVEALISQGIKVLIICPQDAAAAGAAVEEAQKAGIKVISYDRLVTGTAAVDYYVTFDSISVGKAQAQYLVDHAKAKTANPLYLYAGAASDNNAFLFFEGGWDVLQPKIADGTFVIKNSSEAVAVQSKATLTRDEMSKVIGQITTDWKPDVAKNLAETNMTSATAADKGDVSILAPNDGTARAIADVFAADKDVKSYVVSGQDAEKASVQYIIDGKQSMTVFKDVRTLVKDAIAAAVTYLGGGTPEKTTTYNNGKIDVPAKPSEVISVDKDNVQSALIDSGYYQASDFTMAAPAPAAATSADCPKAEVFCVGLVTDVGKVDDKSFNQSAWEGVQKSKEDGVADVVQYIETTDAKDYAKNISQFGDAGYDVIVTVGFALGEATDAAAATYPDVRFIGVDQFQAADVAGVTGLNFPEDNAGFLVGALAAQMTKSSHIGGVFATDAVPPVWRFGEGYRAGAMYINKDIKIDIVYHNDVGFDKTFTDPEWAANAANAMIDGGADVIFAGGGKTGNGAVVAAAQRKVYAIGVDTDQYFTLPEAAPYLLSSAMKLIVPGVSGLVAAAKDGSIKDGNFVGVAAYAPFHDLDSQVSAEIKAKMEEIAKGLIDGSIKTNVAPVKP